MTCNVPPRWMVIDGHVSAVFAVSATQTRAVRVPDGVQVRFLDPISIAAVSPLVGVFEITQQITL